MGAVDIVPGVSGSTVALLLGIYERIIATLRAVTAVLAALGRGQPRRAAAEVRQLDWWFAVPLLAGIVAALFALASPLEYLLEEEPEAMAGVFFGLVVASVVVVWLLLQRSDWDRVLLALAVGGFFFWLLGLGTGPVSDPSPLAYAGSGALAVCVLLLPGISGSFVLLMLGMYPAVIGALDDRAWGHLALVAAGAAVGAVLFSGLISRVLHRWRDLTLAAMVGLLLGSLRVLWPWPAGVGVISREEAESVDGTGLGWPDNAGDLLLPTLLAVVAAAGTLMATRLSARRAQYQ